MNALRPAFAAIAPGAREALRDAIRPGAAAGRISEALASLPDGPATKGYALAANRARAVARDRRPSVETDVHRPGLAGGHADARRDDSLIAATLEARLHRRIVTRYQELLARLDPDGLRWDETWQRPSVRREPASLGDLEGRARHDGVVLSMRWCREVLARGLADVDGGITLAVEPPRVHADARVLAHPALWLGPRGPDRVEIEPVLGTILEYRPNGLDAPEVRVFLRRSGPPAAVRGVGARTAEDLRSALVQTRVDEAERYRAWRSAGRTAAALGARPFHTLGFPDEMRRVLTTALVRPDRLAGTADSVERSRVLALTRAFAGDSHRAARVRRRCPELYRALAAGGGVGARLDALLEHVPRTVADRFWSEAQERLPPGELANGLFAHVGAIESLTRALGSPAADAPIADTVEQAAERLRSALVKDLAANLPRCWLDALVNASPEPTRPSSPHRPSGRARAGTAA